MKKKYDRGLALGTGKSSIAKPLTLIETHEAYAAKLYNIPITDVTPEQRKFAKRVRFMELYSDASMLNNQGTCSNVANMDYAELEKRVQSWTKDFKEQSK